MPKVERFEDLIAWQKARALTTVIYRLTREGAFARDFGLSTQIQRAAVSVMANIAEGFERDGLKDFRRFVSTAKSSCAEIRSHLYVAMDIQYITEETFSKVNLQAQEVARIIGGLRSSLITKIRAQKNETL